MNPLLLLLLCVGAVLAGPIMFGPISLTGSGVLTNPDFASDGGEGVGGLGLFLKASGSDGVHTVSINTEDVELLGSADKNALDNLVFSIPFPSSCNENFVGNAVRDMCHIYIDGVTGPADSTGSAGTLVCSKCLTVTSTAICWPRHKSRIPGPLLPT